MRLCPWTHPRLGKAGSIIVVTGEGGEIAVACRGVFLDKERYTGPDRQKYDAYCQTAADFSLITDFLSGS